MYVVLPLKTSFSFKMNVSITDMALNQSVFLIRSIDHFYVTMPVETTIIALIAMENTDHYD